MQSRSPHDSTDEAIGRRLKESREARGLTQLAVSTRSKWVDAEGKGVSRTALVAYEAGTSRPGARELRILCETLTVSPNYLIFGAEDPFEVSQASTEGTSDARPAKGISQALQFGLVVASLKGHERSALLSLALSLAGRQLGDLRLSGLRAISGFIANDLEGRLAEWMSSDGDSYDAARVRTMSLEDIIDVLSRGMTTNIGNRLKMDEEGNVVGGEWLYPDPKP